MKKKNKEEIIKNFYGRKINLNNNKSARIERINWYLLEGFILAFVFSMIDIIAFYYSKNVISILEFTNNREVNMYIYVLIEFVLLYLISFIIDYVYYELKIKRINKKSN